MPSISVDRIAMFVGNLSTAKFGEYVPSLFLRRLIDADGD